MTVSQSVTREATSQLFSNPQMSIVSAIKDPTMTTASTDFTDQFFRKTFPNLPRMPCSISQVVNEEISLWTLMSIRKDKVIWPQKKKVISGPWWRLTPSTLSRERILTWESRANAQLSFLNSSRMWSRRRTWEAESARWRYCKTDGVLISHMVTCATN